MTDSQIYTLPTPVSDADHMRGNPNAELTIVKYGDFDCYDCSRSHALMRKTEQKLGPRVRFVFRHFPLIHVHPNSLLAAEASEAAAAQGKFWEMYDRLYSNPGKLEEKHLVHHAKKIGLDIARFEKEMGDRLYSDPVQQHYQKSLLAGITGTPTFYINGVRFAGTSDPDRVIKYIQSLHPDA